MWTRYVVAALSTMVVSTAAFAPVAQQSTTTELSAMTMENMKGSINFLRKPFVFDPLKLSETYEPLLPFVRDAELRHGRTAMVAVAGLMVPEFVRIPGEAYSFESIPRVMDAPAALWEAGFGSPMFQLVLWIGFWEAFVAAPAAFAAHNGERIPGDYGMAAWLETTKKPPTADRVDFLEDSELLNGRLAMIAFVGLYAQSFVSSNGFPYL